MCKAIPDKKTVPAFSIIEAIVGMAVTAIVMSMIFAIFNIVSANLHKYQEQNEVIGDLNRVTYSINKDLFENTKMTVAGQEVVFSGYAGEQVKYSFQQDYILRSGEKFIDTFKISLKQIVIDSFKSNSNKIVFQRLRLKVEINEKNVNLKFYKRLYANELIEAMH